MKYAKLIDGVIHFAPNKIKDGDTITYNPPAEMLEDLGYLPVVNVPAPDAPEGYYYAHSWAEENGTITDVWTLEEMPEDDSPEAILNIILGGEE